MNFRRRGSRSHRGTAASRTRRRARLLIHPCHIRPGYRAISAVSSRRLLRYGCWRRFEQSFGRGRRTPSRAGNSRTHRGTTVVRCQRLTGGPAFPTRKTKVVSLLQNPRISSYVGQRAAICCMSNFVSCEKVAEIPKSMTDIM